MIQYNIEGISEEQQQTFRYDMESFITEFEDVMRSGMKQGIPSNRIWRNVRDTLLIDFPLLREAYSAHGIERNRPIEEQSISARLGRIIAGHMYHVRQELDAEFSDIKVPTEAMPSEKVQLSPSSAWAKPPVITTSPATAARSKYPLADEMLDKLSLVKPGQEIVFTFKTRGEAINGRSFVAHNLDRAGWYDDVSSGKRPYATTIRQRDQCNEDGKEQTLWELKVVHLPERWQRRSKKRQ